MPSSGSASCSILSRGWWAVRASTNYSIGSRRWGHGAASGEIELDTGVFTGVLPRDVLEAHGGWDSGFPINQDSELAARFLVPVTPAADRAAHRAEDP